ncbi:hypothetical protein Aperf_G00000095408 [Anoplocephala perfoliata]
MTSSQPNRRQSPKVYLRDKIYSPAAPELAYDRSYTRTPVSTEPGDTIIYTRQPVTMLQSSGGPSNEQTLDADDTTLQSAALSEASNDSKISKSSQRPHRRYHHNHHNHRRQKIEDPDGYWQVPHTNSQERSELSTTPGPYKTPGGRQLAKTPKKHTAGVQVMGIDQVIGGGDDPGGTYEDFTQEIEDYMQSSQYRPMEDPEMSVSQLSSKITHLKLRK